MKKIFMSFLVFLVSFTSISPVLTVSAVESSSVSLSSYKTTVRGIVDKYVKNLDDQNFTDDQIVNSLTKLRDSYQKLLSSARSTKKAKIQIIVNTINQVIGEVQNRDDNNDTDLYNLFNQAPVRNTSTTTTTTNYYTNTNTNTVPSCTKELKMCSNGSYVGRSGPSCSFAECPMVTTTVTNTSTTNTNLYVSLYGTAQSQYVSTSAGRQKVGSVTFTAGNKDVYISNITVTRSGLGRGSEVLNIRASQNNNLISNMSDIYDPNTQKGVIYFQSPIKVSANSTQTIDILVSLSAQENTQHQFTLTSVEANAAIIGVPITLGIFNTVASTTIPTVNNIIGISVTNNREAIGTTLIAQKPDSLYKEYDEYLYTPSATPGQPSFRQFINKPESLIYTYYNNYTMTTQFLSETSPDAVKSIRSLAENSPRILKTSRFFTKDNKLIVDGFLDDAQFARDARSVEWYLTVKNPNAGLYNFYHLYIAKDNSEAFIVSSSQTGIKKNGIVYISMDTPVQSQYVPKNLGRGKIATIKLTAGNNDASISSLKIKRSGLGDPREILLISANTPGNWTNGNVFDSFDVTTQEGTINFATPIYIKANQSVTLEVVVSLSSVNGNTQHIFNLIGVETSGTITGIPITLGTLNTTTASTY